MINTDSITTMKTKLTKKSSVRAYLIISITSVGASLTTLVALTTPDDPAYKWYCVLLAGVTMAANGLVAAATKEDEGDDQE